MTLSMGMKKPQLSREWGVRGLRLGVILFRKFNGVFIPRLSVYKSPFYPMLRWRRSLYREQSQKGPPALNMQTEGGLPKRHFIFISRQNVWKKWMGKWQRMVGILFWKKGRLFLTLGKLPEDLITEAQKCVSNLHNKSDFIVDCLCRLFTCFAHQTILYNKCVFIIIARNIHTRYISIESGFSCTPNSMDQQWIYIEAPFLTQFP